MHTLLHGIIQEKSQLFFDSLAKELIYKMNELLISEDQINDIQNYVYALQSLKNEYTKEIKNKSMKAVLPPQSSEYQTWLAKNSKIFYLNAIIEETLEELHRHFSFSDLYRKNTSYTNVWTYLLYSNIKEIPEGFYFCISHEKSSLEEDKIYYYIDKNISLEKFIQIVCKDFGITTPEEVTGDLVSEEEIPKEESRLFCNPISSCFE